VTVAAVVREIGRHPLRFLEHQWNWKAALVSTLLRGTIFFASTMSISVAAAARALAVDAAFRAPLAGTCAGLVQAVRRAEPKPIATAVAVVGVPALAHGIEVAIHAAAATPLLWRAVAGSVVLSIVSSAVELFLMRRDVMIVGPGAGSLASDLRRLSRIAWPGTA